NWQPRGRESRFYAFQRWWLTRGLHRGVVTINGRWCVQPAHVYSFLNPCLTEEELDTGRQLAATKQLSFPIRLIYVGRLEEPKGVGRALDIMTRLLKARLPITLDLVGDGPERRRFERGAIDRGVASRIRLHGWLPRPDLAALFAQSHIVVLPSSSEGWPKVL